MTSTATGSTTKDAMEQTLAANRNLQTVLNERAQALQAELQELDGLVATSSAEEGEGEVESEVVILGSKRATGLFPSGEFLNESSPYYTEARRRSDYIANTSPRPFKEKETEVLTEAVRKENERLKAYRNSALSSSTQSEEAIDLVNNLKDLDWVRIAEQVSDISTVSRSPDECRIAWVANARPLVNHSPWSQSELKQLATLVSHYHQQNKGVNWAEVAIKLGTNRFPIDCMRHGTTRERHVWTPEFDHVLVRAVELYGVDNWHPVARMVSEHATPVQCQTRWTKSLDPSIKRRPWTSDEDDRLRKTVGAYGPAWVQVAPLIPGRTNDQCRERWTEHLSRGDQNVWTEEQDRILKDSVEELGNKWKEISARLEGKKTGQACRARYDKLKRAEKRQIDQPSRSSTPMPPPVHTPTAVHFHPILPVFAPTSEPNIFVQRAPDPLAKSRLPATPSLTALPCLGTSTVMADASLSAITTAPSNTSPEIGLPGGYQDIPVSKTVVSPGLVGPVEPTTPNDQILPEKPRKRGRKQKVANHDQSSLASSAPKKTRVTRSQMKGTTNG